MSSRQTQGTRSGRFLAAGTMEDNYFRLNTAANGAGVWQNNCPKLTHSHNQFDSNTATLGCGGIELNQGRITVDSCYFTKCRGVKGGAIYLQVIPLLQLHCGSHVWADAHNLADAESDMIC